MIWRLLDPILSRLVGRLLRLSPVDPKPLTDAEADRLYRMMMEEK